MSFDITIPGGESRKLKTGGKYCPEDIVVTAEGGGAFVPVEEKDVCFWDYDGTLLYSYTVEEAQALTELPPLPSQPGLICQGWNYDLETIKRYNRMVDVGATYITDDGKTRVYITMSEGRLSPMLGVCPNGTVTVDWGDNSETVALTGTSTSTVVYTENHTYPAAGDYVITLAVDGQMGFYGSSTANIYSGLLHYANGADARNLIYINAINKVEIGTGVKSLSSNNFNNCKNLETITIPSGVTSIGYAAFYNCSALKYAVLPHGVTGLLGSTFYGGFEFDGVSVPDTVKSTGDSAFRECYSLGRFVQPEAMPLGNFAFTDGRTLKRVSLSPIVKSTGQYTFQGCSVLGNVSMEKVETIGGYAFNLCASMGSMVIPETVSTIGTAAFNNCYGLKKLKFLPITPPTVSNANAFNGIQADCEVEVPAESLETYQAATNYGGIAAQMVGV